MAYDYHINFTDPSKTAFVVKPYTVNGYATPDSVPLPSFFTAGNTTAVSANTSLVFVGKGMQDYGDAVQNNFLYLLENFANANPPIAHIEGQLWYKNVDLVDAPNPTHKGLYVSNGTSWDRLLVETATGASGNLNMGGFVITNVGGIGVNYNAASESYVASSIATHSSDVALHLTTSQNALLDGLSPSLTATHLNYVEGVSSSIQLQFGSKVSKDGDTMNGSLSMGSNRITSLAGPINLDDAATMGYVLAQVAGTGTLDGVVDSGFLDPLSGVLTLTRTVGTPVVISGEFAPKTHTQTDTTVTHDLSTPVSQSFLVGEGISWGEYPQMTVNKAITHLDQMIYSMQRHVHRQLIVSTGTTTISLAPNMSYEVDANKLQVYVNGIKQYANERGSSKVVYYGTDIGLMSVLGLTPSTSYSFVITVDGGAPTTISITTPATTYTFYDLLVSINAALVAALVPASVNVDQYLNQLKITFTSHSAGTGSSVTVSYAVGSLFEAIVAGGIVGDAPVNTSISATYAYTEVGQPNELSTTLEFGVAPATGAVLEVLSWP